MTEIGVLIVAVVVFAFALVSRRLQAGIITAPMVFLGLGWMLGESGLFHLANGEGVLYLLAEVTLVVVLFTDAAAIDLAALRSRFVWPARMLVLGLPLAMLLGSLAGLALLPQWPFWEVVLLATILAPTDAALGQAVVTNPAVPERVRRALNVESGVNDGLALPAVLLFGCVAVGGVHDFQQTSWLLFAAKQIGLGLVLGATAGALGALAMGRAADRGFTSASFEGIGILALAALCYLLAVELGGNGFLSAFVGGLVFGTLMKGRCSFVFEFMETEGQLLVLATFALVGAALAPLAIRQFQPGWLLLIIVSLVLVRPASIWLSLSGTDAKPLTRGFMGWFGPRGLATVLFALLVVGELQALEHGPEILMIAVATVLVSAVLHGLSAAPGARWFARRSALEE